MADTKFSALTTLDHTSIATNDKVVVLDVSVPLGKTIVLSELSQAVGAAGISVIKDTTAALSIDVTNRKLYSADGVNVALVWGDDESVVKYGILNANTGKIIFDTVNNALYGAGSGSNQLVIDITSYALLDPNQNTSVDFFNDQLSDLTGNISVDWTARQLLKSDGSTVVLAWAGGLGFFGATPVGQPASANQTAITDSTGGSTANTTIVDVGVVFSQANINANFAKVTKLLNQIRADQVTLGLIKGSA